MIVEVDLRDHFVPTECLQQGLQPQKDFESHRKRQSSDGSAPAPRQWWCDSAQDQLIWWCDSGAASPPKPVENNSLRLKCLFCKNPAGFRKQKATKAQLNLPRLRSRIPNAISFEVDLRNLFVFLQSGCQHLPSRVHNPRFCSISAVVWPWFPHLTTTWSTSPPGSNPSSPRLGFLARPEPPCRQASGTGCPRIRRWCGGRCRWWLRSLSGAPPTSASRWAKCEAASSSWVERLVFGMGKVWGRN